MNASARICKKDTEASNVLQLRNEMWIIRFLFLEYFDNSGIVFDNNPFSYKNLSVALQWRNVETWIPS